MRSDCTLVGPVYGIKESLTSSGKSITTFKLKTWRKDGDKDKSTFWSIVTYNAAADVIAKYAEDGTILLVMGELDVFNKHGEEKIQVIAKSFSFMGKGKLLTKDELYSDS